MTGYSTTTFQQLVTALSIRLGDPTFIFWSQAEIQALIIEALQTWQAFSQFYTTKAVLPITANTAYYDLFANIPTLTPSITDRDLIPVICRELQEPLNNGTTPWVGTEQYSLPGIISAIQTRRDRFFMETGLVLNLLTQIGPSAPINTVVLPGNVLDVRRAMWKDRTTGNISLLWRADEYTMQAANPTWLNNAGTPIDYSTVMQQPLGLAVSPPPINMGDLLLLTVNSGPVLNPASAATVLGIPDDFWWVLKFGALADLYSQAGPGADSFRADYCEERWNDGIKLARMTNFVKLGQQNGVPGFVDSIYELDTATPSWVGAATGVPNLLGLTGNIIGLAPIPNGIFSLSFDITPKMILPPTLADYVQIGQELIDPILNYSSHLAHIKEGVREIQETYTLYKNLVQMALVENDILRANAQNFDVLSDRSQRDSHFRPRRQSDIALTEVNNELGS